MHSQEASFPASPASPEMTTAPRTQASPFDVRAAPPRWNFTSMLPPPSASDLVLLLDVCVTHFVVNDVRLPLWASAFNSEQGSLPQDPIFYYAAPVIIDPAWQPRRASAERSQAALPMNQASERPRKRACSVEDLCLGGYHKASLHLIFDPSVVRSKALAALLASLPPDQAPHIKETNLRPLPVERLEFALEHALPLEQLGMRCCSASVPEFTPNRRVSLDVLAPNHKMASDMAQAFERVAIVYTMTFSALKISASIMVEALKLAKEEALKRLQQLHQKQIFVPMSQYLESPPLKRLFASSVGSAVSGLGWSVRDGDAVVFLAQLKRATSDFRRCVGEPILDEFYSSCGSAGRSQAATVSDASSKVEQLALKLVLSKSERVRLWPVVSDSSALAQRNSLFASLSHSESRFLYGVNVSAAQITRELNRVFVKTTADSYRFCLSAALNSDGWRLWGCSTTHFLSAPGETEPSRTWTREELCTLLREQCGLAVMFVGMWIVAVQMDMVVLSRTKLLVRTDSHGRFEAYDPIIARVQLTPKSGEVRPTREELQSSVLETLKQQSTSLMLHNGQDPRMRLTLPLMDPEPDPTPLKHIKAEANGEESNEMIEEHEQKQGSIGEDEPSLGHASEVLDMAVVKPRQEEPIAMAHAVHQEEPEESGMEVDKQDTPEKQGPQGNRIGQDDSEKLQLLEEIARARDEIARLKRERERTEERATELIDSIIHQAGGH